MPGEASVALEHNKHQRESGDLKDKTKEEGVSNTDCRVIHNKQGSWISTLAIAIVSFVGMVVCPQNGPTITAGTVGTLSSHPSYISNGGSQSVVATAASVASLLNRCTLNR